MQCGFLCMFVTESSLDQWLNTFLTGFISCSFVWAAAGKQPDLENRVGVGGYGYPAMVALNVKKGAHAPLKSAFELEHIM